MNKISNTIIIPSHEYEELTRELNKLRKGFELLLPYFTGSNKATIKTKVFFEAFKLENKHD